MVTGGANLGRIGVITNRERHPGSFDVVHVKDSTGNSFATRLSNIFVIGKVRAGGGVRGCVVGRGGAGRRPRSRDDLQLLSKGMKTTPAIPLRSSELRTANRQIRANKRLVVFFLISHTLPWRPESRMFCGYGSILI